VTAELIVISETSWQAEACTGKTGCNQCLK